MDLLGEKNALQPLSGPVFTDKNEFILLSPKNPQQNSYRRN
jgi:hypothetical protein